MPWANLIIIDIMRNEGDGLNSFHLIKSSSNMLLLAFILHTAKEFSEQVEELSVRKFIMQDFMAFVHHKQYLSYIKDGSSTKK